MTARAAAPVGDGAQSWALDGAAPARHLDLRPASQVVRLHLEGARGGAHLQDREVGLRPAELAEVDAHPEARTSVVDDGADDVRGLVLGGRQEVVQVVVALLRRPEAHDVPGGIRRLDLLRVRSRGREEDDRDEEGDQARAETGRHVAHPRQASTSL